MTEQLAEQQFYNVLLECMTMTFQSNPVALKQAEDQLAQLAKQPIFPMMLMKLAGDSEKDESIRLAGAIRFKNFIRSEWNPDERSAYEAISREYRTFIKDRIVELLIAVPEKLQLQISAAVSIIAETDFYEDWTNLLPDLVNRFSETDYKTNNGILQTAHSIFGKWRSEFQSDYLFATIKYSLENFCDYYQRLFIFTDQLITNYQNDAKALKILAQSLILLIDIFYDFNCQDLPEYFEDNMKVFIDLFLKYLAYSNPLLKGDDEDVPGPLEQIKAGICEIFELYLGRYEADIYENSAVSAQLPQLFSLLCNILRECGTESKYDNLVGKALSVLTQMARSEKSKAWFASTETLKQLLETIVLKNIEMREVDEELFEDNPIEYIRKDLEGSDSETRRRAAVDFIRALTTNDESNVSTIMLTYIQSGLQTYANNTENWKSKDTAMTLFVSIAATATTEMRGVTRTNPYVNVAEFFQQNFLNELQHDDVRSGNPFLKVDAIKMIYLFRTQLSKEQLMTVFPLLIKHLQSSNYAVYTYAAITIKQILLIPAGKDKLFTSADIKPHAEILLTELFRLIELGQTPEKLAENDYLMQTVMHVVIASEQDMMPYAPKIMDKIVTILNIISRNPSNPKFNHSIFECIGALIRFICPIPSADVEGFKKNLFAAFKGILTQTQEFAPYVYQLMAQLLEQHQTRELPEEYMQLLVEHVLTPSIWSGGNIPALVRFLQAYLRAGVQTILEKKILPQILGVFQGNLLKSKFDHHGMALLNTIIQTVPTDVLNGCLPALVKSTLERLMTKKKRSNDFSDAFTRSFSLWTCQCFISDRLKGPDQLISVFEGLQVGLFENVMNRVVLSDLKALEDRIDSNICSIGLVRLLTQSELMCQPAFDDLWGKSMKTLLAQKSSTPIVDDEMDRLEVGNMEEGTYSRLVMATPRREDPTSSYPPFQVYLVQELTSKPPAVRSIFKQRISGIPEDGQKQLEQCFVNAGISVHQL